MGQTEVSNSKEQEEKYELVFEGGNEPNVARRGIVLGNVDLYKDAILDFKAKILSLVQERVISEQVGNRIIMEAEYDFFKQLVEVEYQQ